MKRGRGKETGWGDMREEREKAGWKRGSKGKMRKEARERDWIGGRGREGRRLYLRGILGGEDWLEG